MAQFIAKQDTSPLSSPDRFQEVVVLERIRDFAILDKLVESRRARENCVRQALVKAFGLFRSDDVPGD